MSIVSPDYISLEKKQFIKLTKGHVPLNINKIFIGNCISMTWKSGPASYMQCSILQRKALDDKIKFKEEQEQFKVCILIHVLYTGTRAMVSFELMFSTCVGWIKRYAWGCKMEKITRLDHRCLTHEVNGF